MTKSSVSLAAALSTFANVKADPSLTKGRNIIDVSNRVAVKTVAIGKFLTAIRNLKAVQVQRNDLYRLTNGLAKHLAEFQLPQTVFHLVRFKGTWYLADGNTRKRFWLSSNSCDLPSHVNLVVYDAETLEEVKAIYNCIDSQKSKKTNRDSL
ncbi:hypothetical protein LC612_39005, partial [Nostoc sp. CHAB 5834]|nr:hypothetical protein [Nostoc sp. CHAB 5834]